MAIPLTKRSLDELVKAMPPPTDWKQFHNPVLKINGVDHRLDAMTISLNPKYRYRDLEPDEDRKREWRDAFRDYGKYIDPDRPKSAFELLYAPEAVDCFIWGPLGEWIGAIKTEEVRQDSRRYSTAPTLRLLGRMWNLDVQVFDGQGFVHPRHHSSYYYQRNIGTSMAQLARFESYRDLKDYLDVVGHGRGHSASALQLAGLIQNVRALHAAITSWIDGLKKADANLAFGFGCLRDGDDKMDALGVLADLNGCEWVWDRHESAYKIKGGDAYSLPDKLFREYLGIPYDCPDRHIAEFNELFPKMMDTLTSHKQVASEFDGAMDVITQRVNDIRGLHNQIRRVESISGPLEERSLWDVRNDYIQRHRSMNLWR